MSEIIESNHEVAESVKEELTAICGDIAKFETAIKDMKEQEDLLREKLYEGMEKNGIVKLETPEVLISYIAPSDSEYFDKARFRKENPGLYDEYVTIKTKKGYVRIKVK